MPRYSTPIFDANGKQIGIACHSSPPGGYCKACRNPSTALCDYPLTGGRAGKTCDVKLCPRCARRVKPEELEQLKASGTAIASPDSVDLCPAHARLAGLK